jgi:hypothetical protein
VFYLLFYSCFSADFWGFLIYKERNKFLGGWGGGGGGARGGLSLSFSHGFSLLFCHVAKLAIIHKKI